MSRVLEQGYHFAAAVEMDVGGDGKRLFPRQIKNIVLTLLKKLYLPSLSSPSHSCRSNH